MIAWEMMSARQAVLAPANANAEIKPASASNLPDDEAEDDNAEEAKTTKAEQPVWRERLDRRVSGGKRKKRR